MHSGMQDGSRFILGRPRSLAGSRARFNSDAGFRSAAAAGDELLAMVAAGQTQGQTALAFGEPGRIAKLGIKQILYPWI